MTDNTVLDALEWLYKNMEHQECARCGGIQKVESSFPLLQKDTVITIYKAECEEQEAMREVVEAAIELISWLNDTGRTNKSRRGRVPSALLEKSEKAIDNLKEVRNENNHSYKIQK